MNLEVNGVRNIASCKFKPNNFHGDLKLILQFIEQPIKADES